MLRRGPIVSIEELQPGDVLLSKATRLYGWLIAGLDRSLYTHAAIWTGEGVVEAVPYSVVHWSLPESVNAKRRQFVDVFRFRDADEPFMQKVTKLARRHEGTPYAMTDVLHMLHGVASSTDPMNVLRPKLPKLMAELREYEGLGPRRGVTCSELVAKAFIEAGRPLHIELPTLEGTRSAAPTPRHADPELEELISLCRGMVLRERALNAGDAYRSSAAATAGTDLCLVTPKDLSRSSSLTRVGRLRRTEEILRYETKVVPKPKSATRQPTVPIESSPQTTLPPLPGAQRLLYIAAAPGHRSPIDSDGELMAIQTALRLATHGKQLDVRPPALRASAMDFADAIDVERPTLIHFAGHGSDLGLVAVDRTLDLAHMLAILGAHAPRLQLVVLNACDTAELAKGLADHVRVVIGLQGTIRETEAKSFASALYRALGNGRSIVHAFELSRRELDDPSRAVLAAKRVEDTQVAVVDVNDGVRAPQTLSPATPRARSRKPLGALLVLALLAAASFAVLSTRQQVPTQRVAASVPIAKPAQPALAAQAVIAPIGSAPAPSEPKAPRGVEPSKPRALFELRVTASNGTSTPFRVTPTTRLHKGDKLALEVLPLRAVYLYVIRIGTKGEAHLLHSSELSKERARKPVRLPADGVAYDLDDDVVGRETIVVVASEGWLEDASPKHAELIRLVQVKKSLPRGVTFDGIAPGSIKRAATSSGNVLVAVGESNGVAVATLSYKREQRRAIGWSGTLKQLGHQ